MADFVQSTNVKSAIRKLANPIADADAFTVIVNEVIANNPFGCVSYMTAGTNHAPVEKTKEAYTVKVLYEDTNAKTVGNYTGRFNTLAGFRPGPWRLWLPPRSRQHTAVQRTITLIMSRIRSRSGATTRTASCTSLHSAARRSP